MSNDNNVHEPAFMLYADDPLHCQALAYLVRLASIADSPKKHEIAAINARFQEHQHGKTQSEGAGPSSGDPQGRAGEGP